MEKITFDLVLARQVEAEMKAAMPTNQWTDGYLVEIIRDCCAGDTYADGHHGAFDAYLTKLGLYRGICPECGVRFVSADPDKICCGRLCLGDYQQ